MLKKYHQFLSSYMFFFFSERTLSRSTTLDILVILLFYSQDHRWVDEHHEEFVPGYEGQWQAQRFGSSSDGHVT